MFMKPSTLAGLLAAALLMGSVSPTIAQGEKPAAKPATFERHKDIAYRTDAAADKERHQLDVFCPKGVKDFPVVLFVHGGAWKWGDKNMYAGIGEVFAEAGIGMVICNYRLSPAVKHPAHIEDVAKAFAWTCKNIGNYGGDKSRLFVCGHSAGGHLVSLLATDPSYLKAEDQSVSDIKGVVAISGVYQVVHTEKVFHEAFGNNEVICKKASPLTHVIGKHPPFLLAYAEKDYEYLDVMAKDMHGALQKASCPSELLLCKNRTHISIVINLINPDDALNKKFLAFVKGTPK